jgi:hypothetical protein
VSEEIESKMLEAFKFEFKESSRLGKIRLIAGLALLDVAMWIGGEKLRHLNWFEGFLICEDAKRRKRLAQIAGRE